MNKKLLIFIALISLSCATAFADRFVNLTPAPANMTIGEGDFMIPHGMAITTNGLTQDMQTEVTRFIREFNEATGLNLKQAKRGQMKISADSQLAPEGYSLEVSVKGIKLSAATAAGLYYGLQTIKKVLPANVMACKPGAAGTTYVLPEMVINDEPAYSYRGFMLDVSRHFFTADDIKRMLDVMSYYKLNRFHWHLSDDQGWRFPVEKYPKLTTVVATSPDVLIVDFREKKQYMSRKPYGPYSYTKEQLKDVVDYAAQRHIQVIPEIDMPGHFVSALTAYPELSCAPWAERQVWSHGGVSKDVLNVADPKAVEFAAEIIDELAEIFPCPYIHIGGDECPTDAWETNAECKAIMEKEGLNNARQLQNRFIKQMADRAATHGKKLYMWNEVLTADGADSLMLKNIDASIFAWWPADEAVRKATANQLPVVYTPFGPYYINRRQTPDSAPGAGHGDDDVKRTYEIKPFASAVPGSEAYLLGVQGTFWTEYVSDPENMEHLALPRLIAIAEAGWTPQSKKNFADFQKRITADAELLDLGNYNYTKLYMLEPVGKSTGPDVAGEE